jgi:hypothetical protein
MITYVYKFLKNGVEVERLTLGLELTGDELEVYCLHLDRKYDTVIGLDTFQVAKVVNTYGILLDDTLNNIKMNGVLL